MEIRMLILLTFALFGQPATEFPALKQRLQRGNYAEARAGYEVLLKDKNPAGGAFVGLALCLRAEGRYSDALEALDAGIKSHPDDPSLLAQRADLFFFLGKWEDAGKDAETAIKKQDANLLARWDRVRLLRDVGDIPAADKEVRRQRSWKGHRGRGIASPHRIGRSGERPLEQQALTVRVHPQ
jgi:tetratricopeptide (TPR) repeat protein